MNCLYRPSNAEVNAGILKGGGAHFVIKWAWVSKRGVGAGGGVPPPARSAEAF